MTTETVDVASLRMDTTPKCETSRVDCAQQVEWYITLPCCDHQGTLCDTHAKEGMGEWNHLLVMSGWLTYECGYCGASPMPRPIWREI